MSVRCPTCKGEGIIAGTRKADGSIEQCKTCKGRGELGAKPKAGKK
jgi:DnaJ-class molecular chaperone